MALETGTYINSLVITNPPGSDDKRQGDDHIRLLKSVLKNTFPNVSAQIVTGHASFNYLSGVTSALQAQLDTKAPSDSPVLTGTPSVPAVSLTDLAPNIVVNLDYVVGAALSGVLPSQTGNADKLLKADGASGVWSSSIDTNIITAGVNGKLVTVTGTDTVKNKKFFNASVTNIADETKVATFDVSSLQTGSPTTVKLPSRSMTIITPRYKLVNAGYLAGQQTLDIMFTYGYDDYLLEISEVDTTSILSESAVYSRFNVGGVWVNTASSYSSDLGSTSGGDKALVIRKVSYVLGQEGAAEIPIRKTLTSKRPFIYGAYSGGTLFSILCKTSGLFNGIQFFTSNVANTISGGWRLYGKRIS